MSTYKRKLLIFPFFFLLFLFFFHPSIDLTIAEEKITVIDILDIIDVISDGTGIDWGEVWEELSSMPSIRDLSAPEWPELEEEAAPVPEWETGEELLEMVLGLDGWTLLSKCDTWYYEEYLAAMTRRYPVIQVFLEQPNVADLLFRYHSRNKNVTEFLLLADQMLHEEYGLAGKIRLAWTCGFKGLYSHYCSTRGTYSYYIVYTPVLLLLLCWLYRKVPNLRKQREEEEHRERQERKMLKAAAQKKELALPEAKSCLNRGEPYHRGPQLLALPPHIEEEENREEGSDDIGGDPVSHPADGPGGWGYPD